MQIPSIKTQIAGLGAGLARFDAEIDCVNLREPLSPTKFSSACLQIPSIKTQIAELGAGLARIDAEILAAGGLSDNEAEVHKPLRNRLVAFHSSAEPEFKDLEVRLLNKLLACCKSSAGLGKRVKALQSTVEVPLMVPLN